MSAREPRRRLVQTLLLTAALVLVGAVAYLGPTAAFHLLSPAATGEAERLARLLEAAPGRTIAEIGAGSGAMSAAIARSLEPGGTLYSTELNPARLRDIRARVGREGLSNVVVVEAGETSTHLPDACCDAIFMRMVYHHITEPEPFNESLRRSLRPGGLLAIIDFEPGAFWGLGRRVEGGAARRMGHGVTQDALVQELGAAGFEVERIIDDWGGRLYLILFRAPAA